MKNNEKTAKHDSDNIWADWSPRPKKEPTKPTHIVSAIVVVLSFVQLMNIPTI